MSVLVKGMKMPSECEYCGFCRFYPENGNVWCNAKNKILKTKWKEPNWTHLDVKRPDWCPLIDLPEKHGKLIDGIELIDYCEDMMRLSRENDEDMRYIIISEICYKNVIWKIVNMPTLLEAEDE